MPFGAWLSLPLRTDRGRTGHAGPREERGACRRLQLCQRRPRRGVVAALQLPDEGGGVHVPERLQGLPCA